MAKTFRAASAAALAAVLLFAPGLQAETTPETFQPKEGDLWVMAGDSITAQKLHSNYIEAFFRARNPKVSLPFRNSGIGGNRVGHVLARFDYDVAAWKPTIVSVELGMNDVGDASPDAYIAGMKKLIAQIRAIPATPILISSSPVNDGSVLGAWRSTRCERIHPFTEALQKLADEEKVLMVDQYHPLLDRWGLNRLYSTAGNLAEAVTALNTRKEIAENEPLQTFAKNWKNTVPVAELGGDAVHPGPVGQTMMAATILKALGVDPEVSSATLKADGTVGETQHCTITNVKHEGDTLSFTRLDERLPWPLEPKAAGPALSVMPEIADLSRYMLKVTGLPEGKWQVEMDQTPVLTVTAAELEKGINLGALTNGPLATHGAEIVKLVAGLQGGPVETWRAASKARDEAKIAEAQAKVAEQEKLIQAACQPREIQFRIVKAQ